MDYRTLIRDILVAIITGLFVSYMYQRWVDQSRSRKLDRQFAALGGEYDEYERSPAGSLMRTGGIINLAYCGGTNFKTEAITDKGERLWYGEIFMRENASVLGAGYYSHTEKDDTGIHRLIYNSEAKHFNVSGENTSHVEGKHDFKMVWQRKA